MKQTQMEQTVPVQFCHIVSIILLKLLSKSNIILNDSISYKQVTSMLKCNTTGPVHVISGKTLLVQQIFNLHILNACGILISMFPDSHVIISGHGMGGRFSQPPML